MGQQVSCAASNESPTQSNTYDIIGSYVRCSADTVQVKRIVSEVLPVHRTNYDNSPLMLALVEYGTILARYFKSNVIRLGEKTHRIEELLSNRKCSENRIKAAYLELLRNWLTDRKERMSWDRVVTSISYTEELITYTVTANEFSILSGKRVASLVAACVQFIERFAISWIHDNGDWAAFECAVSKMMFKEVFDIPVSSTADSCSDSVIVSPAAAASPANTSSLNTSECLFEKFNSRHLSRDHRYEKVRAEHHGILSAYILHSLKEGNKIESKLSCVISHLESLGLGKDSCEKTQTILKLKKIGNFLKCVIAEHYDHVFKVWKSEIDMIISPSVGEGKARVNYDTILLSYLIPSGEEISWDRVVMVLEFTADLVSRVSRNRKPGHLQRSSDLMMMGAHFLSQHMHSWIVSSGGWRNAVLEETEQRRSVYDAVSPLKDLQGEDQFMNQKLLAAEYELITSAFHDDRVGTAPTPFATGESGDDGVRVASGKGEGQPCGSDLGAAETIPEDNSETCESVLEARRKKRTEIRDRLEAFQRYQHCKGNIEISTTYDDDVFDEGL